MMKQLLTFNPRTKEFKTATLETNLLQQLYEIINCRMIEKITISDNNIPFEFDIIMDEEGKLKGEPVPAYKVPFDYLCGTIVFTRFTEEGEWIGLSREEIKEIKYKHRYTSYEMYEGEIKGTFMTLEAA